MEPIYSPVRGHVEEIGRGWCTVGYAYHGLRYWSRDRVLCFIGMNAVAVRVGATVTKNTIIGHSDTKPLVIDVPRSRYRTPDV